MIYASNVRDALHDRAEQLVRRLAAGPELLYLFWPVLLGYVRIVTHPVILPTPVTLEPFTHATAAFGDSRASRLLNRQLGDRRVRMRQ